MSEVIKLEEERPASDNKVGTKSTIDKNDDELSSDDDLERKTKAETIMREICEDRRRIWEVIAQNSSEEELLELSGKNGSDENKSVGSLSTERRKYFDDVRRGREDSKKRRLNEDDTQN